MRIFKAAAAALMAGLFVAGECNPAHAGESQPAAAKPPLPASPPTLTGNWAGWRTKLADHGLTLQLSLTGFLQAQAGGDGASSWINDSSGRGSGPGPYFGGRMDALFEVNTQKMGLWAGGSLHGHLELELGELPGWSGGALWPVNTAAITPIVDQGQVTLSSLFYRQRLWDTTITVGKINALDLLARDPFFGGWGIERFQNLAFVASPNGVTQLVMVGGSIDQKIGDFNFTALVFDPNNRGDDSLDHLFAEGVNFSFSAQWNGKLWGRPSNLGVSYNFSTRELVDLEELYLPSDLRQSSPKMPDSFVVRFGHQFWASPVRPGKGIGFYGRVGFTEGNPNPIQWSLACGITGEGMWESRPWDDFGIGVYHYEWSEGLSTALLTDVGPETGLEAYYNFAVTSWLVVSPDLQVGEPATQGSPVFNVLSLRALIRF